MKVTKYPQSCLILEKSGTRIIIDPGTLVSAKFQPSDLLPVAAILLTHEHPDHVDPTLIDELINGSDIPLIANKGTAAILGDRVTQTVEDGQTLSVAGFDITARELPHSLLVDGSAGPQNTGYLVDKTFFHAGDGISISNLSVETAAIPIAGPDISPRDVFDFINQLGCHTVIPIHYEFFTANPDIVANDNFYPGITTIILSNGQSIEL